MDELPPGCRRLTKEEREELASRWNREVQEESRLRATIRMRLRSGLHAVLAPFHTDHGWVFRVWLESNTVADYTGVSVSPAVAMSPVARRKVVWEVAGHEQVRGLLDGTL